MLLESHFDYAWVEGEISNFAAPSSGHWYFSLKDGSAQVRCAMFRNRNIRINPRPANGDAVRLRCRVSLYEGRGEFQLIVEFMEAAGAGALQAAFDKLKAKLLAEGLFDETRKIPVPHSASRVGIVTSPTGAAIHDILTVFKRRSPGTELYLFPVAVQGEGAAEQISAAIDRANRWHSEGSLSLDALIIGRGGGSLEDLWAFNEEQVARSIARSQLPIVSAVGHEVDFSISDWVADQRAATPSAAAELLSHDQVQWQAQLAQLESTLLRQIRQTLGWAKSEIGHLQRRLKHPGHNLQEQSQRLDELEQRLRMAQDNLLLRRQSQLGLAQARLKNCSPVNRLTLLTQHAEQLANRLRTAMTHQLGARHDQLSAQARLLDSLSPLRTLDRGFAIVTDTSGQVVREAHGRRPGEELTARLARGQLRVKVEAVLGDKDGTADSD
jgi:exodeoxyribonuclease VII large subunit